MGSAVVGVRVGIEDGEMVEGAGVICVDGSTVGLKVGILEGVIEGGTVGKEVVATIVGEAVGRLEGRAVGDKVGGNVTKRIPWTPEIAAFPEQVELPIHPSLIIYCWRGVPAGTVYCTCAQTFSAKMHGDGGLSPVPVSSYTTSTPDAVYMRIVVCPWQKAPGYIAAHMDTVNVCPD